MLLVQLEAPDETVDAALDMATQHGLTKILDPAPFRVLSDDTLRKVDVLTPNQSEASRLVGFDVTDTESAVRASRSLLSRVNGNVVITLGVFGCLWASASGEIHFEAKLVESVDSTGAGDAFNGALAQAIASGCSMMDAITQAVAAGTFSTLGHGAAPSMPIRSEVDSLIDR